MFFSPVPLCRNLYVTICWSMSAFYDTRFACYAHYALLCMRDVLNFSQMRQLFQSPSERDKGGIAARVARKTRKIVMKVMLLR